MAAVMHQIQCFLPLSLLLVSSLPSCSCRGIAVVSSSQAVSSDWEIVPVHQIAARDGHLQHVFHPRFDR